MREVDGVRHRRLQLELVVVEHLDAVDVAGDETPAADDADRDRCVVPAADQLVDDEVAVGEVVLRLVDRRRVRIVDEEDVVEARIVEQGRVSVRVSAEHRVDVAGPEDGRVGRVIGNGLAVSKAVAEDRDRVPRDVVRRERLQVDLRILGLGEVRGQLDRVFVDDDHVERSREVQRADRDVADGRVDDRIPGDEAMALGEGDRVAVAVDVRAVEGRAEAELIRIHARAQRHVQDSVFAADEDGLGNAVRILDVFRRRRGEAADGRVPVRLVLDDVAGREAVAQHDDRVLRRVNGLDHIVGQGAALRDCARRDRERAAEVDARVRPDVGLHGRDDRHRRLRARDTEQ